MTRLPPPGRDRRATICLSLWARDAALLHQILANLPEGCDWRIHRDGPPPALSQRQHDILEGLKRGLTNKEIGRALALSPFTVRNHVTQILRLMNMRSRKDLPTPLDHEG